GSGIGLALCKELVELHKGEISAISHNNSGSLFSVKLPISKSTYSKNEIQIKTRKRTNKFTINESELNENAFQNQIGNFKNDKPILLFVEDNQDMQIFISSILKEEFNIINAFNGEQAYNLALEYVPDIIISDYMM